MGISASNLWVSRILMADQGERERERGEDSIYFRQGADGRGRTEDRKAAYASQTLTSSDGRKDAFLVTTRSLAPTPLGAFVVRKQVDGRTRPKVSWSVGRSVARLFGEFC